MAVEVGCLNCRSPDSSAAILTDRNCLSPDFGGSGRINSSGRINRLPSSSAQLYQYSKGAASGDWNRECGICIKDIEVGADCSVNDNASLVASSFRSEG
jgi:hypothetical protein